MTQPASRNSDIEQVQQSLVDLALDPSLPEVEVIEHFRTEHRRLQSELLEANARIEEISKRKAEHEPFENELRRKEQVLATTLTNLERLAVPLGKAAFEGIKAGMVEPHSAFYERVASNETLCRLKIEQDALQPSPRAGFMEKAKLMAQQLVVAGKIKLEETKLHSQEALGGKRLLADISEESVRCDQTANVLGQIAIARSEIAQKRKDVDHALEILKEREASLRSALALSQIDGTASLDAELFRCGQHQAGLEVAQHTLERTFCDALASAETLPQHDEFLRCVTEFCQLKSKISSLAPLHTVRGAQDLLEVYDSKVAITPKGVRGFLNKGITGTKDIPFASISAIQFRKSGTGVPISLNGFIQFTVPGGNESRGGLRAATKDENTFMFTREHNDLMGQIKDFIERRISELRAPQAAPYALSLSDELQKLARLHAQGILSVAEFQAAKSRLIGQ